MRSIEDSRPTARGCGRPWRWIPGLLFLIAFVVAAGLVVLRDLRGRRYVDEPWSAALIASVIALVVGQLTETLLLVA